MEKQSLIYVAGHNGLVGSAIVNNLTSKGYTNLIFKTHADLDLKNQDEVKNFFETEQPEYVILAAAKVGGIIANNTCRADFIYENLMIQNNVIHQSYLSGVKKLLSYRSRSGHTRRPHSSRGTGCRSKIHFCNLERTHGFKHPGTRQKAQAR